MSALMSISHNLKPAILVSPSLHHSSSFPILLSFKPTFSLTHPLNLTRRLFLPSVSGIWDALTGANNNAREAVLAIRRGMSLFRQVSSPILLLHRHLFLLHFVPLWACIIAAYFCVMMCFCYSHNILFHNTFCVCLCSLWIVVQVTFVIVNWLLRVMFRGLLWSSTRQFSWILVKRRVGLYTSGKRFMNSLSYFGYETLWLLPDLWQRGLTLYYLNRYLLTTLHLIILSLANFRKESS